MHKEDILNVQLSNGSKYYLPAIAGDLPHGEDMKTVARAYIKDMTEDGGKPLAACHVAIMAEFSAALAAALAETK